VKIAYITHTRFPTEKAHGHQVAYVCDALAELKHDVTLIAPTVRNAITMGAHRYYGISETFTVEHLPNFDALASHIIPGKLAFRVSMWSYRRKLKDFLSSRSFDLLYARSPVVLGTLLQTNIPVVLELHTIPRRNRKRFVAACNRCKRVVALTSPMRKELEELGVVSKSLIVAGDAVNPARFAKALPAAKAKHHWDLPADRPVVGYVGSLVTHDRVQKGVDVLIHALAFLKKHSVPVFGWIVGGPEHWQHKYRWLAHCNGLTDDDIRFQGHVNAHEIPDALSACDICVYTAPRSRRAYFRRDTSPLKLFEYLAAGRPIVCADIPPVRDVVSEKSVRLYHPGDSRSMAGGIRHALEHSKEAKERTQEGLKRVQEHTWEKRMQRILEGIGKS